MVHSQGLPLHHDAQKLISHTKNKLDAAIPTFILQVGVNVVISFAMCV
jgi:hypothetical protein